MQQSSQQQYVTPKPKKKKTRNLHLTDRDLSLFKYLFANKIAKVSQIRRDIFKNGNQANVYERLARLKKAGYILSTSAMIGNYSKKAYSLTRKGFSFVIDSLGLDVYQRQVLSDTKNHDLDLVDLCHGLRKFKGITKIVTENVLVNCNDYRNSKLYSPYSKLRSDLYCLVCVGDRKLNVALEYERSLKANSRVASKMLKYYIQGAIDFVIYVASNDSIKSKLMKIDKEVRKSTKPKIYFSTLNEVQNCESVWRLENSKSVILKID